MTGLLLEGGGMKASLVAGAVMALMDKGLVHFDAATAVSASVPTLAYLAAGQRKEIEAIWRNELSTSRLVCYRNLPAVFLVGYQQRPIIDIRYLVYEVCRKRYPVHVGALRENGIDCHFAVARVPGGDLDFLQPNDNDIYTIFMAAMVAPACYPSTIPIDACEYIDGGTANHLPIEALKDCNKLLVILSRSPGERREPLGLMEKSLFWRYFRRYGWVIEKVNQSAESYNHRVSQLMWLAKQWPGRVLMIYPDEIPPTGFITRNRRKINQTIDLGYSKTESMEERVRNFLLNGKQQETSMISLEAVTEEERQQEWYSLGERNLADGESVHLA